MFPDEAAIGPEIRWQPAVIGGIPRAGARLLEQHVEWVVRRFWSMSLDTAGQCRRTNGRQPGYTTPWATIGRGG